MSRRLRDMYQLPLTHVDTIQFMAGMKVRDVEETRGILNDRASAAKWIIDGFGPMDVMEKRFALADRVIFIDFPLWRHYWWATKRQIQSIWKTRPELPDGCNEASIGFTFRLFRTLWRVHKEIRPQLLEIFGRGMMKERVLVVRDVASWNQLYRQGIDV